MLARCEHYVIVVGVRVVRGVALLVYLAFVVIFTYLLKRVSYVRSYNPQNNQLYSFLFSLQNFNYSVVRNDKIKSTRTV